MQSLTIYFEDIRVGDEMPALVKPPIQRVQLARYAGASGDFNPIHLDDEVARAAGMGGILAHGMLSMSFVAQSIADWLGAGSVKKLGVRFTALVRPGDVITCKGKVLAKSSADAQHLVELDVLAENQKGETVVTGRATASLPSRG